MQIDDSFLLTLAELAERGLNLSIVLSVGGATIQGTIITEEEYHERLSELVEAGSPEQAEQAEHLREFLRGATSTRDESAMRYLDEGGDPETARELREALSLPFIHLRDTRILLPDGNFVSMAAPWRGKQSAVDGYWLGGSSEDPLCTDLIGQDRRREMSISPAIMRPQRVLGREGLGHRDGAVRGMSYPRELRFNGVLGS